MSEYKQITKLEEIVNLAKLEIDGDYKLNFNIKVNFDIQLINKSILSVSKLALDFQNPVCPNNLHMNHGAFIHKKKNGIQNVINELKEKNNSNRAIISLINQEDIVDSGDNPIPSLMILQFSIENHTDLYVTVYFKALEVSKFLRVNIEEIRIIISDMYKELMDIRNVYLNILAFRAYIKEDISTLERAELDQLSVIKIAGKLSKNVEEFILLLEEKKKSSTVIEYESFSTILECITDDDCKQHIEKSYTKPLVSKLFSDIIDISKRLKDLREKSSHSPRIDECQLSYIDKIDELIRKLRNDD